MWIRQCARLNQRRFFKSAAILLSFVLFLSSGSIAAETIILKVILNQEQKGEFFVNLAEDGDFLIREEDLRAIGFKEPKGKVVDIAGEPYISLRSMGVEFRFIEKTISLEVTAHPTLLPKREIDFTPRRQPDVYYPRDNSAFLNYRLDRSETISPDSSSLSLTNQLGIRNGDYLFLSDSSYAKTDVDERFVRLMTNITHDRREDMRRTVFGDFFASSGDLGGSVNMGGLSFSKVYMIDPYFIKYPLLDLSGSATLPSEVEVYLDGMKIRSEKLPPGEFDLKNISYYGGASTVEVVIKDSFGRIQRIVRPFYFSDTLLKKGLHEYSYNIGLIREDFGVESNLYGDAALSFFHRYGMSDRFTLGFRGEGGGEVFNLGPQGSYLMGNSGVFSGSLSLGTGEDGFGVASSLTYSYQNRRISTRLFAKGYTEEYSTIGTELTTEKPQYEAGAGIGYNVREFGSVSLDYATIKKYEGEDMNVASASFSKSLTLGTSVFLIFRNIKERESSSEIFAGLNIYPWRETTMSVQYLKSEEKTTKTVELQKNPPFGEGIGYRASFENADTEDGTENRFNPFVQYNSRYGILSGEYSAASGGEQTYQITASGAVIYVGETIGLTRPVYDSFGLVKVGGLEGIRVYQSGQEIGRSGPSGRVLVPSLSSYYNNQISIEDKDIPMDYTISEVQKYVSPSLRSGSLINFEVTRFQAITGTLKIRTDGDIKPVEYREISVTADGKELTLPTGKGGEFYMENIRPGRYEASFRYYEKKCSFDIIIPESDETIIDLGVVVCEDIS